jgi:hypothetical protein
VRTIGDADLFLRAKELWHRPGASPHQVAATVGVDVDVLFGWARRDKWEPKSRKRTVEDLTPTDIAEFQRLIASGLQAPAAGAAIGLSQTAGKSLQSLLTKKAEAAPKRRCEGCLAIVQGDVCPICQARWRRDNAA